MVLPARRELVYAAAPAFWYDFETSSRFLVATSLCFTYFLGLLTRDNKSLTCRVCHLDMLMFVILMVMHSS